MDQSRGSMVQGCRVGQQGGEVGTPEQLIPERRPAVIGGRGLATVTHVPRIQDGLCHGRDQTSDALFLGAGAAVGPQRSGDRLPVDLDVRMFGRHPASDLVRDDPGGTEPGEAHGVYASVAAYGVTELGVVRVAAVVPAYGGQAPHLPVGRDYTLQGTALDGMRCSRWRSTALLDRRRSPGSIQLVF